MAEKQARHALEASAGITGPRSTCSSSRMLLITPWPVDGTYHPTHVAIQVGPAVPGRDDCPVLGLHLHRALTHTAAAQPASGSHGCPAAALGGGC
jgi:hypothetical protein